MTNPEQGYYLEAYEKMSEAYSRAERMDNVNQELLSFRKHITAQGIRFPNIDTECKFRKEVGCKKTDNPQQMVLRYATVLDQTFERRHPQAPNELERGLAG